MQAVEYLSRTETVHSVMSQSLARFQHLAEVNTPPNHGESFELRSIISESDCQLSDLKKILAEAKQTVNSLKQRVDKVAFVLNTAKKITHPLRSLPDEILCLIFAQCVGYNATSRKSLLTDHAPWTLSYVCSRWRRLVLSFPSLWTTPCFDFTIYGSLRNFCQQTLYLVTVYIERSRALPLDVTVRVIHHRMGHYFLRHIIQATTARWRSAVLDLPLAEILLLKGCSFPLLETVKIRNCRPDISDDQDGQDVDTFSSLPVLRSVIITSESSLSLQSIPMPWRQIVEYNFQHHAFSTENLDVLKQMTSLRYLVAYVVVGFGLDVVDPVVLPSLRYLKLSVAARATKPDDLNLSSYLAFLRMPLLSHLILNYCEPNGSCPVLSHPNFPSVKALGIHLLDLASINTENLVDFLSFMDGVEELELSGTIISDKLLQVLTPSEDGMLVLPRLRVLHTDNAIYGLTDDDDDPAPHLLAFHNMLFLRSRAHKCLIFTLEKLTASLAWRDENHPARSDEDLKRWDQICDAITVVYLDTEFDEEE